MTVNVMSQTAVYMLSGHSGCQTVLCGEYAPGAAAWTPFAANDDQKDRQVLADETKWQIDIRAAYHPSHLLGKNSKQNMLEQMLFAH